MDPRERVRGAVADQAALRAAVAEADIVPLLLCLVHLTGDETLLDRARPHVSGGWNFLQSIPDDLQREIRERLIAALNDAAASGRPIAAEPPPDLLERMMAVAVGQPVPAAYRETLLEEASFSGTDRRTVAWRRPPAPEALARFRVVVIGAGLSGIAMAIKLGEAGIPFVVLEKNAEAGGTWLENVYPGAGVDTPCHFYSFSFAPNAEWSAYFAKQRELLAYLQDCVARYGIRPHIRFGEAVERADYDAAAGCWRIVTRTASGEERTREADVVISAVGALNRPARPAIPGLDGFQGPVVHTAEWDPALDLRGRRVAMIGTGASGMQTAPAIAPEVARLTIFQRSPHWAIRHPLYHAPVTDGVRWATRHIPFYASWFRLQLFWAASDGFHATLQVDPDWDHPDRSLNAANDRLRQDLIAHITAELGDRTDLLDKVVPTYPPFGKRMLRDNHWYRMLRRDNVELVTDRIARVTQDAVIAGGVEYPADAIVLATGFEASRMLASMRVAGRDGETLHDRWNGDDPRAHLGITVPGFPNFFMLYGPNTNLAHGGSIFFHTECQVRYVVQALRELLESGARTIEVRQTPFEQYNQRVDAAHERMVWSHPGVTNWYRNARGRVVMNSPWRLADYRDMLARFSPEEFEFM